MHSYLKNFGYPPPSPALCFIREKVSMASYSTTLLPPEGGGWEGENVSWNRRSSPSLTLPLRGRGPAPDFRAATFSERQIFRSVISPCHVGKDEQTAADYYLAQQSEMLGLLGVALGLLESAAGKDRG